MPEESKGIGIRVLLLYRFAKYILVTLNTRICVDMQVSALQLMDSKYVKHGRLWKQQATVRHDTCEPYTPIFLPAPQEDTFVNLNSLLELRIPRFAVQHSKGFFVFDIQSRGCRPLRWYRTEK
jgi:hypothetical protein